MSDQYHRLGNGDGTISAKDIKKQKQLRKQIEHHNDQAARHRDKAEPSQRTPDQKDFDRMDRKGDKDRRSKAWNKRDSKKSVESALDNLIKAQAAVTTFNKNGFTKNKNKISATDQPGKVKIAKGKAVAKKKKTKKTNEKKPVDVTGAY